MSGHVELKRYDKKISEWDGDSVVLLLREKESAPEPFSDIAQSLADRHDFTGKRGSLFRVSTFNHEHGTHNIYFAGLGSDTDKGGPVNSIVIRNVLTSTLRSVGHQHNKSVLVLFAGNADRCEKITLSEVIGEAVGLCSYDFDKYKSKDSDKKDSANATDDKKTGEDEGFTLKTVFVPELDQAKAARGEIFAAAQSIARDWDNEPGCVVWPAVMSSIAQDVAKDFDLECEVWDEEKLKAERMGSILAVGSGSKNPPRLVHLTWRPTNVSGSASVKKIVLVGKGITFDSGGINLKPGKWLRTMKGDKSGACIMLAVLRGAAELKLPIEIHAVLPFAENLPSGSSYKPDDIVRARNGKTIEIDDTDAEGRVLLSDALSLASELKPDVIIDVATLTGSCVVGLGQWRAGLFSNDDTLANALLAASRRRGEELWRLPEYDTHLAEELKSPIADLINVGESYGDAIFATMFLSEFVGEKISWAHLDIAGCDFVKKEWGVYAKGMSCFGVRTILDYLVSLTD